MNEQTINIILVVAGAILVGLIWALDRANKRLSDSVPPNVMGILGVAVTALETLANRTPTPLDNEVIGLLRLLLLTNPPATPPAGTVTTTGTAGSTVVVTVPPSSPSDPTPVG